MTHACQTGTTFKQLEHLKKQKRNEFDSLMQSKQYLELKQTFYLYQTRKQRIHKHLKKGTKLEIGCGITPITEKTPTTTHTDKSLKTIQYLGQFTKNNQVLDIEKETLPKKYDQIICSEVLEHLEDDKIALQNMRKMLKKGGEMIITVPIHKNKWDTDDEIVGHKRRYELGQLLTLTDEINLYPKHIETYGNPIERKITTLITKKHQENKEINKTLWFTTNTILKTIFNTIDLITPQSKNNYALIILEK